jgi:hypothetical protein
VAAPTRAELDRRAALLDTAAASCSTLNGESCIAIPRRVAINAVVPVTVNGTEVMALWGADLASVIRAAGVRQPEEVLGKLAISRPHGGHSTPIDFDRTSNSILRLPLAGGEVISWSR